LRPGRSLSILAFLVVLGGTVIAHAPLRAQQAIKPDKDQAQKVAPIPARMWKSQTTGNEYRVWTEDNRLHAEWTNIPPGSAAKGAYIRTVCRRAGEKWVGEAHSYLPCLKGKGKNEQLVNFCHVTTGFEINTRTASRITGRTEGLKRFDCSKCQVLEKEWKNFVWVPMPPKKGPGHEVPESR
jgi:hypothetical protein